MACRFVTWFGQSRIPGAALAVLTGIAFTLPGFVARSGVSAAQAAEPAPAEDRLRADVETLASATLEGRGFGTAGLEKATAWLEERFREAGLQPPGDGGYRQTFTGPDGATLVNLVGVVGDPAAGRHVVLGAHYDHLGFGEEGNANRGKLHPGADDNASGVAALLECARRLNEDAPARPVIVVAFGGEEKGLLGSAWYAAHPALPLADCTAMINLDTVGRLGDGPVVIFGSATAAEFPRILEGVNMGFSLKLELPEKDPGGSDQMSFTPHGVPAIQIFSGANADYHRPGDTPDKIDYAGLTAIVDFTTELALYLADREDPLNFVPPGAEKVAATTAASGGAPRRVSFGSIPDFNHSGDGVLLTGVLPGSPAEAAGLRAGDLIVEFGGVAVADLKAFSDVLKTFAPGDAVTVVYLRDGERHSATGTVVERK